MFKNLMLYRLLPTWQPALADADAALAALPFAECGATQQKSLGWVPPRGQAHGAFLESVAGQWLAELRIEAKQVPGEVLKRQVEALVRKIEADSGRQPGKRERRDLKDQALLDLLPMAFARRAGVKVWLSLKDRLLVLDAGSAARADEVLAALTQAWPGFGAQLINTAQGPAAAMADWLVAGEAPAPFTIDRDCELKAAEGEKPVVRYARHPLDLPEIAEHIAQGKRPTRLALSWRGRVSFVLTEGLQLKRIGFDDGVFEGRVADGDESFDANLAIATGELAPLIDDLIAALGGEEALGASGGAASPAAAGAAPAATPTGATADAGPKTTLPPWEAAAV